VNLRKHKLFQRDGNHLILQLPITYSQAALGATIEVPTLGGKASLDIPGGTQSGEVFRMRGKGMPDVRGGRNGDLLVQTVIEVPKKVSGRQEELLRELAELERTDVTPHRQSFWDRMVDYFAGRTDETDEAKT
jgi:molecular chaperone DnaJ